MSIVMVYDEREQGQDSVLDFTQRAEAIRAKRLASDASEDSAIPLATYGKLVKHPHELEHFYESGRASSVEIHFVQTEAGYALRFQTPLNANKAGKPERLIYDAQSTYDFSYDGNMSLKDQEDYKRAVEDAANLAKYLRTANYRGRRPVGDRRDFAVVEGPAFEVSVFRTTINPQDRRLQPDRSMTMTGDIKTAMNRPHGH